MDFVGSIFIPVGLVLSGIVMAWLEIRNFLHPRDFGPPPSAVRLGRRILGCITIMAIGGVIHYWVQYVGPTLHKGVDPPYGLVGLLLALVFFIIVLAMWDAIEGVRGVRKLVDQMHREDMTELHDMIRRAKEKSSN